MGMFDDLVPQNGQKPSAGGGMFDDLVPQDGQTPAPAAPAGPQPNIAALFGFADYPHYERQAPVAPATAGDDIQRGLEQVRGQAGALGAIVGGRQLSALEAVQEKSARGEPLTRYEQLMLDQSGEARANATAALQAGVAQTIEAKRNADALPINPNYQEFREASGRPDATIGSVAKGFIKHPWDIGSSMLLEGLPAMAPALAVGAAMGPGAAGVVAGGQQWTQSFADKVTEYLAKAGVNVNDPEALKAAMANPELMGPIREKAAIAAAPNALMAGASMLVGGKTLAPASMGPVKQQAVNIPAQAAVQGVMAGAGEAGGNVVVGDPVEWGKAATATIGGALQGPVDASVFAIRNMPEAWRASVARQRGVTPDKVAPDSVTPAETLAALNDPQLIAAAEANGIQLASDPRIAILKEKLAARRVEESYRDLSPPAPGEFIILAGKEEGKKGAFSPEIERRQQERANVGETSDVVTERRGTPLSDQFGPRNPEDVRRAQTANSTDEGTIHPQATNAVPRQPDGRPIAVDTVGGAYRVEPGAEGGRAKAEILGGAAQRALPAPGREVMTPEEIARQRAAAEGGNQPTVETPPRLMGGEGRAPQTSDDVQGQREAGQAFTLADRQRQRAGEDVRDTQVAGRPEGRGEQVVHLDEGHPVEILDRRMVPDQSGRMVEVARVRRTDPRTGQAAEGAVEYDVPVRQLQTKNYAPEPRRAQDFETRAQVGRGPAGRIDEAQGLPRQTYRTTAPDPNVQAEGPLPYPGPNRRNAPDGSPMGDRRMSQDGRGRAPFPEQPEGPYPGREWSTAEEAVRDFQQRQARGEANGPGAGGPEYANQKTSNKTAAPDRDGRFVVDENGYVASDKGGPVKFGDQKQAARWIINVGHKKSPDQVFEIANHPGGKGFTVRERGRSEKAQAGPQPEQPQAGPQPQPQPQRPAGPPPRLEGPRTEAPPAPEAAPQTREQAIAEEKSRLWETSSAEGGMGRRSKDLQRNQKAAQEWAEMNVMAREVGADRVAQIMDENGIPSYHMDEITRFYRPQEGEAPEVAFQRAVEKWVDKAEQDALYRENVLSQEDIDEVVADFDRISREHGADPDKLYPETNNDIPFPEGSPREGAGGQAARGGDAAGTPAGREAGQRGEAPRGVGADRATDAGPDGKRQTVIPGAERISDRAAAERQGNRPLRGGNEPPPAGGLFDEGARNQRDMFDQPTAGKKQVISIKETSPDVWRVTFDGKVLGDSRGFDRAGALREARDVVGADPAGRELGIGDVPSRPSKKPHASPYGRYELDDLRQLEGDFFRTQKGFYNGLTAEQYADMVRIRSEEPFSNQTEMTKPETIKVNGEDVKIQAFFADGSPKSVELHATFPNGDVVGRSMWINKKNGRAMWVRGGEDTRTGSQFSKQHYSARPENIESIRPQVEQAMEDLRWRAARGEDVIGKLPDHEGSQEQRARAEMPAGGNGERPVLNTEHGVGKGDNGIIKADVKYSIDRDGFLVKREAWTDEEGPYTKTMYWGGDRFLMDREDAVRVDGGAEAKRIAQAETDRMNWVWSPDDEEYTKTAAQGMAAERGGAERQIGGAIRNEDSSGRPDHSYDESYHLKPDGTLEARYKYDDGVQQESRAYLEDSGALVFFDKDEKNGWRGIEESEGVKLAKFGSDAEAQAALDRMKGRNKNSGIDRNTRPTGGGMTINEMVKSKELSMGRGKIVIESAAGGIYIDKVKGGFFAYTLSKDGKDGQTFKTKPEAVAYAKEVIEARAQRIWAAADERARRNGDFSPGNTFHSNPLFDPAVWKWFGKGLGFSDKWRAEISQLVSDLKNGASSQVGRKVTWGGDVARLYAYSNDGWLRSLGNAHKSETVGRLADLFFARADAGRFGAVEQTYTEAVSQRANRNLNELSTIMEPFFGKPDQVEQIVKLVENRNRIRPGTPIHDAAAKLAKLLDAEHRYMTEAGVKVGYTKDYYRHQFDPSKVLRASQAFLADLTRAFRGDGLGAAEAKEAAQAVLDGITLNSVKVAEGNSDFVSRGTGGPSRDFTRERVLSKNASEIVSRWRYNDPLENLTSYFQSTARRAEWARRMGDDLSKWAEYKKALTDEGNAAIIGDVVRAISNVTGSNPASLPSSAQSAIGFMRAYSTIRLLPHATITSLSEALMPSIRAGSPGRALGDLGRTVAALWKRSGEMGEQREFAEDLGLIMRGAENGILATRYNSLDPHNRAQERVLNRFFRHTGLEQWTSATRVVAVNAAEAFIRRMALDIADGKSRAASAKSLLAELGVKDVDGFSQWVSEHRDEKKGRDITEGGHAATYRNAVIRFSHQAIMAPSASTRPQWATHPLGSVIFMIQSYSYAFHKNVLNRAWHQGMDAATNKDYSLGDRARILAPVAMLPALFALQFAIAPAREAVFGTPGSKPETDEEKFEKRLWTAFSRSGLTGAFDPMVNLVKGARYSRDAATTLAGPGIGGLTHDVIDTIVAAWPKDYGGANSSATNTAERNIARAVYGSLVAPTVSAGATLLPAPLGAPIMQAATSGPVRDAFIDNIAGPKQGRGNPNQPRPVRGARPARPAR